jgi:hypothetical protein
VEDSSARNEYNFRLIFELWTWNVDTVKDPDFVARGLHGELKAARLCVDIPIGPRYIVVVYREIKGRDGFIITARLGSDVGNLIRGGVVWLRK